MRMALAALAPALALGLSDAESALFAASSCYVTEGACNGAYLQGSVTVTSDSSSYTIASNNIPGHATCPDSTASGATCYTAPLTTWFSVQSLSYQVPKSPTAASTPGCLPAGAAAIARNGVLIFSAYSRPCTDAFADEAIGFDSCMGHPQEQGQYHYHTAPVCLPGWAEAFAGTSEYFIGVAWDGYPIYGPYDANGNYVANSALDSCHGYDPGTGYRYIANDEFPYIIGCYKGETPYVSISCHCANRRLESRETNLKLNLTEATERAQRRLQKPPPGSGAPPGSGGSSSQDCDTAGNTESYTMCGTNGFSGDAVTAKNCWGASASCTVSTSSPSPSPAPTPASSPSPTPSPSPATPSTSSAWLSGPEWYLQALVHVLTAQTVFTVLHS